MQAGIIKPFDMQDHFAGHLTLKVSEHYTTLSINGRDFYFYPPGDPKEGELDGTGMAVCTEEAAVEAKP